MSDPTALGALTAALEKLINAALAYDPGTRIALGKLAGKVLAVESSFPAVTFYLCPQAAGSELSLRVQALCEVPADTHLKGSLPAVLALALGSQHSLANSGVEVSGSTGLLSDFQDLMNEVDIDWEEAVSAVLGVTVGHQFAQALRSQAHWAGSGLGKAQGFIGDYLTEELRTTPAKAELDAFYSHVDELRSDADRIAAKVQHLEQRLNPQSNLQASPHINPQPDNRQGD